MAAGFFGFKAPFPNDVSKQLIDYLYKYAVASSDPSQHIEIEAKYGILVDNATGKRLQIPITTETILNDAFYPTKWYHFDCFITAEHFQKLNRLLHDQTKSLSGISFSHSSTVDTFYNLPGYGRCRVTTDAESGAIIEIIQKTRLADLRIFMPNSPYDVTVSVNSERVLPPSQFSSDTAIPLNQPLRYKKRTSYSPNELVVVDFTQVTPDPPDKNSSTTPIYEVEMEIKNFEILRNERQKLANKQDNSFVSICNGFLAGIRTIPALCSV